jgi:hypothetical protein
VTGCTSFLVNLLSTPVVRLDRADPEKLAAKYGLTKYPWGVEWVRGSIEHHRRRG